MAGHRLAAAAWRRRRAAPPGADRNARGLLGGLEGVFCGSLLGLNTSTNRSSPGLGCDLRPSIMGRSCATDRGRSECRTLRQVSMADRKPGR